MPDGLFFALEGIDGAGTTTQRDLLGEYLRAAGNRVHLTAEPSAGPVGVLIRAVLSGQQDMSAPALALLFAGDRLDHLSREIEPALDDGALVITDRYTLSSLAYQSLDLPQEWVQQVNALARAPDATFYLRVSPTTAKARLQKRGLPRELFETDDMLEAIALAYEEALALPLGGDIHVVDAEAEVETVAKTIQTLVDAHLKKHAEMI